MLTTSVLALLKKSKLSSWYAIIMQGNTVVGSCQAAPASVHDSASERGANETPEKQLTKKLDYDPSAAHYLDMAFSDSTCVSRTGFQYELV